MPQSVSVTLYSGGAVGHGVAGRVAFLEILGLDVAGMQKAEMRGVDVAFETLEPVAFALQYCDRQVLLGNEQRLVHGHGRRLGACTHIYPDQAGALIHLVAPGADLLLEVLRRRHIRHFEATPFDIEFPAVIDAPDAVFLVAAEEQRGAAVGALMVEHADPAGTVAKGDELFAEQHQPHGVAVGLQFGRERCGNPILPHQLAHHRARANPRQILAVRRLRHVAPPFIFWTSGMMPPVNYLHYATNVHLRQ